jgi:hypothetical protein
MRQDVPADRTFRFASRSLSVHLLRGVVGVAAAVLALKGYFIIGWPAFLLLPVTPWMFRGCPMCWLSGLFETLARARAPRPASPRAADPA